MPYILFWARRAAALSIGALTALFALPISAQTLAVADLPPPPSYALDIAPPMNAAAQTESAPHLPVQFPSIREDYGPTSHGAPLGDLEPRLHATSPGTHALQRMPRRAASPGRAHGLPGDPAALSKADRQRLREMRRNARREAHAFTGRLMRERDALETLYEAHPRPAPEAVGAIYGRIFAIQREMVEARVRRANALYELFHAQEPPAPAQADDAASTREAVEAASDE